MTKSEEEAVQIWLEKAQTAYQALKQKKTEFDSLMQRSFSGEDIEERTNKLRGSCRTLAGRVIEAVVQVENLRVQYEGGMTPELKKELDGMHASALGFIKAK